MRVVPTCLSTVPGSTSDFETELPLHSLPAGDYLLTVNVQAGQQSADRALRFRVEAEVP